ncbi:hypothetical protein EDD86DRAFT_244385 [Gorgonomyces haynaldii]|nr:hypothetical protein EDD86DRAFT_244385 [Gorgonomyces haynaldii]
MAGIFLVYLIYDASIFWYYFTTAPPIANIVYSGARQIAFTVIILVCCQVLKYFSSMSFIRVWHITRFQQFVIVLHLVCNYPVYGRIGYLGYYQFGPVVFNALLTAFKLFQNIYIIKLTAGTQSNAKQLTKLFGRVYRRFWIIFGLDLVFQLLQLFMWSCKYIFRNTSSVTLMRYQLLENLFGLIQPVLYSYLLKNIMHIPYEEQDYSFGQLFLLIRLIPLLRQRKRWAMLVSPVLLCYLTLDCVVFAYFYFDTPPIVNVVYGGLVIVSQTMAILVNGETLKMMLPMTQDLSLSTLFEIVPKVTGVIANVWDLIQLTFMAKIGWGEWHSETSKSSFQLPSNAFFKRLIGVNIATLLIQLGFFLMPALFPQRKEYLANTQIIANAMAGLKPFFSHLLLRRIVKTRLTEKSVTIDVMAISVQGNEAFPSPSFDSFFDYAVLVCLCLMLLCHLFLLVIVSPYARQKKWAFLMIPVLLAFILFQICGLFYFYTSAPPIANYLYVNFAYLGLLLNILLTGEMCRNATSFEEKITPDTIFTLQICWYTIGPIVFSFVGNAVLLFFYIVLIRSTWGNYISIRKVRTQIQETASNENLSFRYFWVLLSFCIMCQVISGVLYFLSFMLFPKSVSGMNLQIISNCFSGLEPVFGFFVIRKLMTIKFERDPNALSLTFMEQSRK